MKSLGYIFGWSCQHFKFLFFFFTKKICDTCQATEKKGEKNKRAKALAKVKSDNSLKNITHSCYGSVLGWQVYTQNPRKRFRNDIPYLPGHCWLLFS